MIWSETGPFFIRGNFLFVDPQCPPMLQLEEELSDVKTKIERLKTTDEQKDS